MHITAAVSDNAGSVTFTFTEDVSAINFNDDQWNDSATGEDSDGFARIDAHNITWTGPNTSWGNTGDELDIAPLLGYLFSPTSILAT